MDIEVHISNSVRKVKPTCTVIKLILPKLARLPKNTFYSRINLIICVPGKFLGLNVNLDFQVTAAATASQQLSQSGNSPGPSRTGTKHPVQGIPHFDQAAIVSDSRNSKKITAKTCPDVTQDKKKTSVFLAGALAVQAMLVHRFHLQIAAPCMSCSRRSTFEIARFDKCDPAKQ